MPLESQQLLVLPMSSFQVREVTVCLVVAAWLLQRFRQIRLVTLVGHMEVEGEERPRAVQLGRLAARARRAWSS